jgi:DNA-binding response OmpR family regulator
MKVLVCEDDKMLARAMQILLERAGYEVVQAGDGALATEIVAKEEFAAILVDIHLPYTSGLELIGYLRNDLKSDVPVLVVSAISDDVIQQQAQKLGADKYILKPYDPKQLVVEIDELVKHNV